MDPRIINTFLGKIRNCSAKKCPGIITVVEALRLLLPVAPRRESWCQAGLWLSHTGSGTGFVPSILFT